ncbi:MAG: isochorismatase family cysteine hydrolase [Clostridiales bacterium]|jgi:nicotinamidase-related amidase|nr:cysteine hydrolase [Eubacteriales bacterium]MDH7567583.1 isochorismatase family cysteine hydrolase [Clostridiales bacterium]
MKLTNREDFLSSSREALGEIFDILGRLAPVRIKDLPADSTAFVIIDMVNGFAREGALKSPEVEALIPRIAGMCKACDQLGIAKLAFADCHTEASPEFEAYPAHCLSGTTEGEVVDEIKGIGGYRLFPKNSTNGFLESAFRQWLENNPQIGTYVVVGDCTDICVEQFSTTLKAWFNMQNKRVRVIVPLSAVDTYHLGVHNSGLMNVVALYGMMLNGIEVVKDIEL